MVSLSEDSGKDSSLFKNSALYQEFLAEREEILRHKWIESEKQGRDIGFEKALLDWIVNHRASWRAGRQRSSGHRHGEAMNLGLVTALNMALAGSLLHHFTV